MKIQIYKQKRQLQVIESDKVLFECTIGSGKLSGRKEKEGDFKTPEGIYQVLVKNPLSEHHLSLGISYPNKDDAKHGLESGLISNEQYQKICQKLDSGEGTLWNTPLGGQIYIHGRLEDSQGSRGCVCLYKEDIEALYEMIPIGTEVEIFP